MVTVRWTIEPGIHLFPYHKQFDRANKISLVNSNIKKKIINNNVVYRVCACVYICVKERKCLIVREFIDLCMYVYYRCCMYQKNGWEIVLLDRCPKRARQKVKLKKKKYRMVARLFFCTYMDESINGLNRINNSQS